MHENDTLKKQQQQMLESDQNDLLRKEMQMNEQLQKTIEVLN